MTVERVAVDLGSRGYEILIGPGLLQEVGERTRKVVGPGPSKAFVVADFGLGHDRPDRVSKLLGEAGFLCWNDGFQPSEQAKSLETLGGVLDNICRIGQDRTDPVIALGGGVVGDVAGLVAALYRRGVPVIQCPTTLLAMVDASVGGKTGVNLHTGDGKTLKKNMAGVFHQPSLVLVDVCVLDTLPDREFRCGLAECVKHAMLSADWGDPDHFGWIEEQSSELLARDEASLCELVRRNVSIKARVVACDEREEAGAGGRAVLNLGHTFAHVIEPIQSLTPSGEPSDSPLLHGEAVSLGLVAACGLGVGLGVLDRAEADRVKALLASLGLPVGISGLPENRELINAMAHDKKVAHGKMRFVVPGGLGRCEVREDIPGALVSEAIDSIRQT